MDFGREGPKPRRSSQESVLIGQFPAVAPPKSPLLPMVGPEVLIIGIL